MLFTSYGSWSGPLLGVSNLVERGLVVWDRSALHQTTSGRSEATGNGLRTLTEKTVLGQWGTLPNN